MAREVPPDGGAGTRPQCNETEVAAGFVGLGANCVASSLAGACIAGVSAPDGGTGVCAEIFRGDVGFKCGVRAPWETIGGDVRDSIICTIPGGVVGTKRRGNYERLRKDQMTLG